MIVERTVLYQLIMPNAPANPDTPDSWNAASVGYAAQVAPRMMAPFAEELVERLEVSDATEALEVAAGSGALTLTLAAKVKSLLATDFAPSMVEILQARVREAGLPHVRCEVMDGQALSLDDASFDRVASSFGVMLFPDRARGFSELRRVLRPGGRAVVSAWAGPDEFEAFGTFLQALKLALPDLPPPPSPPPVFSLADPADFRAQMQRAGFEDVEVQLSAREVEVSGLEEMWAVLTAGAPPVQMLFDRIGTEGKQRVYDALARLLDERFGSGPARFSNSATIGTGTVPG